MTVFQFIMCWLILNELAVIWLLKDESLAASIKNGRQYIAPANGGAIPIII